MYPNPRSFPDNFKDSAHTNTELPTAPEANKPKTSWRNMAVLFVVILLLCIGAFYAGFKSKPESLTQCTKICVVEQDGKIFFKQVKD